MYYYAVIELESGICYDVIEVEDQMTDDPSCIEIGSYDKSYLFRKKYVDGLWVDTTPAEAQQFEGRHIGINGEWLDVVINNKADISHTHEGYANVDHSHTEYASSDNLQVLEDMIGTKADSAHTHSEYSPSTHTHDNYVNQDSFNILDEKVDGKADANHSHSNYAPLSHSHTASDIGAATSGHNHDSDYADISHSHTEYATTTAVDELSATVTGKANASHNHNDIYFTETEINSKLANKADSSHNHNGVYDASGSAANALTTANEYTDSKIDAIDIPSALSDLTADSTHRLVTDAEKAAWNAKSNFSGSYNDLTNKPSIPSISGLATETYVDEAVSGKADSGHTHGDIYYTESEINSLLSGKANSTHNHNSSYDALGTAETKASAVQANLDVVSEELTEHIGNNAIHFTAAERTKLSGIAANANNYTLPSAGTALGGVKSGGDVTISSGVITVNDDSHNHVISNVDGLQSALDGKASSSHNHDNAYYIQSQVDTKDSETLSSAQAYADDLNTSMNSRMNSVESKLNTIASNAEPNQNAFTNVVVGSTTIAADSKTDTLTIAAGTGVSITPDATNDKVTITNSGVRSIATGSTNGTISVNTNGTSANVAVKGLGSAAYTNSTAYDVAGAADVALDSAKEYTDSIASGKANTSHTHTIANITNLQSTLDGKAASSHTHTVANISDLTATATELNYVDGVTSNIQTQLDGKAATSHSHTISNVSGLQSALDGKSATSHTHSAATTSAAGLMSASDKSKLDGIESGANKYTLPTASSSTLGGVKTTSTVTSNSGYTACPIISGVPYYKDTNTTYNLGSFGVTATSDEINKLDGVTVTTNEINYLSGVTSNIQTQLNGKAASSHGTHVSYSTTAPNANGTASVGTASTVSRSDHVHPLQTTVSGNAGTATKLATARTISLTGDVTGSVSFDGSANASITATVADDSHNHIISNVDGLQTALDGKAASAHTHTDNVQVTKTSSPQVTLTVNGTNIQSKIYKNANSTTDYGTIIADYDSNGAKDSLILRRGVALDKKLSLTVQNSDGSNSQYYLYGEHHKPTASEVGALSLGGGTINGQLETKGGDVITPNLYISENGQSKGFICGKDANGTWRTNLQLANENNNCVLGYYNYSHFDGLTNIYGDNVNIYANYPDGGGHPAGTVFTARNANGHTLINYTASLDDQGSCTYIYGSGVHIRSNDDDFTVDNIQLAHTDKASISSFSSGWTYYGTASANTPTVRRYGKVVSLTGALTNTKAVTLNTTHVKVFTIPSGYRPSQDIIVLCQGSGANEFCLQIKTDGSVSIGRYGTSSFSSVAAEQWFPFHVSWVME